MVTDMETYLITTFDKRQFIATSDIDILHALAAPYVPPVSEIQCIDLWEGDGEWMCLYLKEDQS